tara:strand:+ start:24 stop:290 length:267 start_codon:yes stop_codon:yes gene_type:complete
MSIQVNMTKAVTIWKDKWRAARVDKLNALDVDFLRAVEAGDTSKQAEVATKKNTLRDVTDMDLSKVKTSADLKKTWPACLGAKPEGLK